MELRLLKLFCVVAEHGSVKAAAAHLHLTPSAISHGLKTLEAEVGCQVFDRVGKRLLLNARGRQLWHEVRAPLRALEQAAAALRAAASSHEEHLRLGVTASACQHLLPPVLRELRRRRPHLQLQIQTADADASRLWLEQNEIDVFLGAGLSRRDGLTLHPVFRDELMLAYSAAHPWADGKPLTPERLRGQSLILYSRSSPTARDVIAHLDAAGLVPVTVMQVANTEAIKSLLRLNLGVSVLAPWAASRELQRGMLKMRPIGRHHLRRDWVLATLAGRALAPPGVDLLRLCRAHAAGLRLDYRDVPG
jgi:DNA-binding transcriptional LysR family regulator